MIYISQGAVFAPTVISNLNGKIINCGSAVLPSFNIDQDSLRIENFNIMTFLGVINFNKQSQWFNGTNSKMLCQIPLTMNRITFINKGSLKIKGVYTVSLGINSLINEDSITAESIYINANLNNKGVLNSTGGSITLNGISNTYNSCIIKSTDSFTFSGSDTLFNSGIIRMTDNGLGYIKIQGNAFKNEITGFVEGKDFVNNGASIVGSGNFRFSGHTINQGKFGSDGLGINFYDGSLIASTIFDVQNILPHSSVTKNPLVKSDTSLLPISCSSIIKNQVCGQATPITITTTSPLCIGAQGQIVISGLEAKRKIQAYLGKDTLSSVFTGSGSDINISFNSTVLNQGYNKITFRLKTEKCGDIYLPETSTVIVNSPSQINLVVIGDTICQGSTAKVKILQSGTGANYQLFEGAVAISPVTPGNGSTLIFNLPNLNSGVHTITVKTATSGCGAVILTAHVFIVVNSSPSVLLNVVAQSPVCNASKFAYLTILKSEPGIQYNLFLGASFLGKYIGSGADLLISIPISSLTIGSNSISVKVDALGCSLVVFSQMVYIVVNHSPTLIFEAFGNTVESSKDSAMVTIKGVPIGISLGVFKGIVPVHTPIISMGNEVLIKLAVSDTVTKDFVVTVKGQIDGCELVSYSDTALIKVRRTITSLSENINSTTLSVFPNPISSSFNILSGTPFNKIVITNMFGVNVFESYFELTSEKIVASDFPKGVYTLQLEGSNFKLKKQLIKE